MIGDLSTRDSLVINLATDRKAAKPMQVPQRNGYLLIQSTKSVGCRALTPTKGSKDMDVMTIGVTRGTHVARNNRAPAGSTPSGEGCS